MSTHQYVYVSFPLDGEHDHVIEELLDDLADVYDGKCCGSGTLFKPPTRDLDYQFYDATVEHIAEFMDAVYAAVPTATARLGSLSYDGS